MHHLKAEKNFPVDELEADDVEVQERFALEVATSFAVARQLAEKVCDVAGRWDFPLVLAAGAYELLFSFSMPGDKNQSLDLVRSNEDMGSDYIENDFMSPTTEEIRNARPLVAVLLEDIVSRVTLIASAIRAGAEGDPFTPMA